MLLIEKKTVLFNNRNLTSPHSSPLNNLNHCTARQNHYQRLRYILTSHSMFTVFLFLSSHRFMWPIRTETQRFISWNMKRATEQREIFTSSVSVLRSPLDDAKSKYISSNQTARCEGNRGDLPTLCVWIGFKQYQSVYLDWNREVKRIVQNPASRGSQWLQMILDVLRNLKNDTSTSSI